MCEQLINFQIANDANATHIITKFCGSKHEQNQVVTSIGNKVYVNFFSDLSYNGKGFAASYKSIASSMCFVLH